MYKSVTLFLLLMACLTLPAQEWIVPIEGEQYFGFWDAISVDDGESVLGIGYTRTEDGYIVKVSKEGQVVCREIHIPGMMLQYYSAVQLDNGNFMAFGVCDDSLCDYNKQRCLRVDVFDEQLDIVSSRMFSVDDSTFECFYESRWYECMKAILSKSGNPVLAALPSFYYTSNHGNFYRSGIRFYEFDKYGDTIKTIDNPFELAETYSIKEMTYEPHSDNLMIVVLGGNYGYDSGSPGIFVADTAFNIVAHQSMLRLGGANVVTDNACEGKWFDGDRILVNCEQYIGSHFTYHTLFIVDSALNVYAELLLPPNDSSTIIPYGGTNTAYVDDSTIFAFNYCGESFLPEEVQQVNVALVDKHLNLLGRKVIKRDNVLYSVSIPATFNDGGCMVLCSSKNGNHYPGSPFHDYELMKFRREDIEITWDVVEEQEAAQASVYPNPTAGFINIPIDKSLSESARLQIFDVKGMKCFDREIDRRGSLITLDVHNLATGLYVYKVICRNREISSGKFVKK